MKAMQKNCLSIMIAIILVGIISVSVHILILQYFQAPELKIGPYLNQLCGLGIRFCTVLGSIFIYLLSKKHWEKIKLPHRVILFAILIMALTESLLRSSMMQIIVGTPWEFQILVAIPSYVGFLTLSFIICFFVDAASRRKQFKVLSYVLLAVLATVILILMKNGLQSLLAPLLAHVPQPESSATSQLPYGVDILIPAYITYIEPTVASFIVFYLVKDQLPTRNATIQGLLLGGIIIIVHAGIYSVLQIACSEGNIFYRIFYYGQFLWEYFALGLLTAYSFALLQKPS